MNRHRWKRETHETPDGFGFVLDFVTHGRTDGRTVSDDGNEAKRSTKRTTKNYDDDGGFASDDDDDDKGHDDDAWTGDDARWNEEREKDTSRCGARRGGWWERPDAWDGE